MPQYDTKSIAAVVGTVPTTIVPPGGTVVPGNISVVIRKVVYASDVASGTVATTVYLLSMSGTLVTGTLDSVTVVPDAPTVREEDQVSIRAPTGYQVGAVSEVGTVMVSLSYSYEYH